MAIENNSDILALVNAEDCPWKVDYDFAEDDKKSFAANMLRFPDPFKAAVATFGAGKENIGKCSYVASFWPTDREVVSHSIALLQSKDGKNFLPTKDEAQRRVWEWTETAGCLDEKIKAMRLLADISDWIPKPGAGVSVTVLNNVMEVPTAESDEAWERKAQEQQEKLVKDAVAIH